MRTRDIKEQYVYRVQAGFVKIFSRWRFPLYTVIAWKPLDCVESGVTERSSILLIVANVHVSPNDGTRQCHL